MQEANWTIKDTVICLKLGCLIPKPLCNTYSENWWFYTVGLEKTLKSPLDCKEIKPVNPKGNQSWIFNGKTDAEVEAPILWPSDMKRQLISKDPDAGEDWRQEENGMTENEIVGWHHWFNGHEFEQTLGDSKRQGSLACCSPRIGVRHNFVTEKQQHI